MNILLINVSLRPDSNVMYFPIGLGYIATAMAQAGYQFDLLDIDAHRFNEQETEKRIAQKDYHVVCMGCIVTGYKQIKDLCGKIRRIHPAATIIVGNSVATSIYETLLTMTEADVAVMGEGDVTIVEALNALQKGDGLKNVAGLCYKDNGRIVRNSPRDPIADISSLPFMDYSLINAELYIGNSPHNVSDGVPIPREDLRMLPVNTARGCIGHCTFCYHNFDAYPFRYRSVDSIVSEIADIVPKFNLNCIGFWDELSLFSKQRAEDFAAAILQRKMNFFWSATCRADCFCKDSDRRILEQLREAGCIALGFSLESSNKGILAAMNKHITVEQFSQSARLIRSSGIIPRTSLVIGYPQETIETIRDTFEVCIRNKIYPSAGFLLPQPGSVMYDYARTHGYIPDEEEYLLKMGDRQDLRLNMTAMTDDEMESAVRDGLQKCNDALGIGLQKDMLIKTQYYRASK